MASTEEFAKQQMDGATECPIYICAAQPLDRDNIYYGSLITRVNMICTTPMDEFKYYSQQRKTAAWFDANLCAYYAGTSGQGVMSTSLQAEWRTVLPVCGECPGQGAKPLVRARKRMGAERVAAANKSVARDEQAAARKEQAAAAQAGEPAQAQPRNNTAQQQRSRRATRAPRSIHKRPAGRILFGQLDAASGMWMVAIPTARTVMTPHELWEVAAAYFFLPSRCMPPVVGSKIILPSTKHKPVLSTSMATSS
eukprot:jgi/Tetstr1/450156/TSEL_037198.t1